jgi:hypothetical protein
VRKILINEPEQAAIIELSSHVLLDGELALSISSLMRNFTPLQSDFKPPESHDGESEHLPTVSCKMVATSANSNQCTTIWFVYY